MSTFRNGTWGPPPPAGIAGSSSSGTRIENALTALTTSIGANNAATPLSTLSASVDTVAARIVANNPSLELQALNSNVVKLAANIASNDTNQNLVKLIDAIGAQGAAIAGKLDEIVHALHHRHHDDEGHGSGTKSKK